MIVTFCGHARFSAKEGLEEKILEILKKTVGDNKAELYLGGCGKFDSLAYSCGVKYKKEHPKISLVFVTPYLSVAYQQNRLKNEAERYDYILQPEIEDKPQKFAIVYRNRYMVEKADLVVAYVEHSWGGAYQMYMYAKRKGKEIYNLADEPI